MIALGSLLLWCALAVTYHVWQWALRPVPCRSATLLCVHHTPRRPVRYFVRRSR